MCFVGKKLNNIADTQPNNTVKSGENRETTEILYHRENEKSVSEYNDQQMKLRMSGENTNNLMKHSDLANGYQRTPPMINNVDIVDNKGRTSLMNACVRGNVEIAEVLITIGSDIDKTDYEGFSPINFACRCGQIATCELLISNGVDINKVGKTKSPLMEACIY
jgi:ankyrin repeat protein